MAVIVFPLDKSGERVPKRRLVLREEVWEKALRADLAPILTVTGRDDEILIKGIESARASAPEEAALLERWLRAGGSNEVGWELHEGRAEAGEPIELPAYVLARPADAEPYSGPPAGDWSIDHAHGDGDTLALARSDGRVEVWDLARRTQLGAWKISLGEECIDDVSLLGDQVVVAWGYGGKCGAWNTRGKSLWKKKLSETGNETRLRRTPSGEIVCWSRDVLSVVDPKNGRVVREHQTDLSLLDVDARREELLAVYHPSQIELIAKKTRRIEAEATRAAFTPDGKRIFAVGTEAFFLIDPDGDMVTAPLKNGTDKLDLRCFAASQDLAVAGGWRYGRPAAAELWLWDPKRAPRRLGSPGEEHSHPIFGVAFTPRGEIVSCDQWSVRTWDRSGAPLRVLAADGVTGIHVTASHLWATSRDGALYGWSL